MEGNNNKKIKKRWRPGRDKLPRRAGVLMTEMSVCFCRLFFFNSLCVEGCRGEGKGGGGLRSKKNEAED